MIQLGVTRVLRPYRRFERDYDRVGGPGAVPGNYPIAFSAPENPEAIADGVADIYAYDQQAREGVVGYSPYLCSMASVPIGSDCLIYIPVVPSKSSVSAFVYVWRIMWRLRNMGDFRRKGMPYSVPKEAFGAYDSRPAIAGNRSPFW